jgi:aryl-alcohol dehydrogenase-like predicted oxidoreductase
MGTKSMTYENMTYRNLGYSDLQISRISMGCVTFGREIGDLESNAIMDRAVNHGINFFDTAEAYSDGESERIIGAWIKERKCRSKIQIGSKISPPYTPERINQSCMDSLRRMQISEIDLYQLHEFHETALREESLLALDKLVETGKIRYVGVSNFSMEQLNSVLDIQKKLKLKQICSIQNNHNLAVMDFNADLLKFCVDESVGTISFSPLGAGFLTGKYKNRIPDGARFDIKPGHQNVYFNDDGFRALENLELLAAESGRSMIELALAWVLKNKELTTTLVGARNISHLDQALAAYKLGDGLLKGL